MLCMLFVLIFIVFMYYFTCIWFAIRPSSRKSAIKLIDWLCSYASLANRKTRASVCLSVFRVCTLSEEKLFCRMYLHHWYSSDYDYDYVIDTTLSGVGYASVNEHKPRQLLFGRGARLFDCWLAIRVTCSGSVRRHSLWSARSVDLSTCSISRWYRTVGTCKNAKRQCSTAKRCQ